MKFNTQITNVTQVRNHEGARAFTMKPAMELYSAVATWSLNDSFYEKNDGRVIRIRKLIPQIDPLFVARLAIYARHQMHMRSAPLVLITELARNHSGDNLVARMTKQVVSRADEIAELLACYQLLNKRTGLKKLNRLSRQLQKGLSASFNRFDEYQFAKYNRDSEIKLRDALFLVHPKAKDEAQQQLFNKIANNKLTTPYTWETELSALGQNKFENDAAKAAAFKAKWEELIDSKKLGYMALLRNLNNISGAGVSFDHVRKVAEIIGSAENVAKAKQFPFRYLAAYRELTYTRQGYYAPGMSSRQKASFNGNARSVLTVVQALEIAVAQSAGRIAGFDKDTKVLIACDVSGSMQIPISTKSKIHLFDIGLMLAMLLQSRCKNVTTGIFGEFWKTILVPNCDILGNIQELYRRAGEVGVATNGFLVIKDLLDRKIVMDKVMMFSDCQLWNSTSSGENIHALWLRYKKEIAPEATLYLFDLRGYGQSPLQLIHNDVYLIAGWSDKIFSVLDAIENGGQALDEIETIVI